MTVEDLENCIAIDEDVCVTGESTDTELVLQAKRMRGQEDEEEDEDLELDDSTPSNIEIMNALKIVKKFAGYLCIYIVLPSPIKLIRTDNTL